MSPSECCGCVMAAVTVAVQTGMVYELERVLRVCDGCCDSGSTSRHGV